MRIKTVGNKVDSAAVVIKNNDTIQINAGQPVVISMDGTPSVVLPSTAGALNLVLGLKYGVAMNNVAVGAFGESVVFGFHNALTLLRQSRSSSTVSWAAEATHALGEYMSIDTVNNFFVTIASTLNYISISTQGSPSVLTLSSPIAVLGQTLASYAGSASSTADTRLYITAAVNAFVRMM